ncbi:hypothetical protein TH63_16080 [Rufibacter radiotolerans]|uniref:DUF4136 domain-containing protein n=1 Tax=Rufibacter radiotolerans TaxID=1379910 RepID=A0A0H4W8N5_9BACT|nr:hypothetical protein [Rufibacter radiotolerans]AKQ46801.1 hypothetical protein TH63_16080 [Rufibacter radiotolerans]
MNTLERFFRPLNRGARLLVLLLFVLAGCAPSTRITGTWKSPQATAKTYNRILVAALTDHARVRQTVEEHLQTYLQQHGVTVTKSMDLYPPTLRREGKVSADDLLSKIKGEGQDAILTVALVDTETETRYVPGNMVYMPMTRFAWYGTFRGYYTYWAPMMYDPGYYREDKVYYLETNLYDAATEKLIWSAQTQSYNPTSLHRVAEKYAEMTVTRMQQEGLVK